MCDSLLHGFCEKVWCFTKNTVCQLTYQNKHYNTITIVVLDGFELPIIL